MEGRATEETGHGPGFQEPRTSAHPDICQTLSLRPHPRTAELESAFYSGPQVKVWEALGGSELPACGLYYTVRGLPHPLSPLPDADTAGLGSRETAHFSLLLA